MKINTGLSDLQFFRQNGADLKMSLNVVKDVMSMMYKFVMCIGNSMKTSYKN